MSQSYKDFKTHRFAEKELLIGGVEQADGLIEDPWVVLETGLIQNQISAH